MYVCVNYSVVVNFHVECTIEGYFISLGFTDFRDPLGMLVFRLIKPVVQFHSFKIYILKVYVYAWVYMSIPCVWLYLQRPEEGIISLGAGVTEFRSLWIQRVINVLNLQTISPVPLFLFIYLFFYLICPSIHPFCFCISINAFPSSPHTSSSHPHSIHSSFTVSLWIQADLPPMDIYQPWYIK